MTDTESGLPPVIEALWGLRGPSRRGGPKPALSLERIVAAAVELADAGGLAALSMGRLAEKLGFTTMSLYRYVASKDDLLVLLLDAAWELPPEPPSGEWREQCTVWARALRDSYRAHPWALELPVSGLPAGPNQLTWFDPGRRGARRRRHVGRRLGLRGHPARRPGPLSRGGGGGRGRDLRRRRGLGRRGRVRLRVAADPGRDRCAAPV
jgi:AcrR family transcriptional regulator